jgi:hypothetical protein
VVAVEVSVDVAEELLEVVPVDVTDVVEVVTGVDVIVDVTVDVTDMYPATKNVADVYTPGV